MYSLLDRRLALIDNSNIVDLLATGLKGVETETLRVQPNNRLAQTPHPVALGEPLTHPYITTDFSESQLELVTPPLQDAQDVWRFQMDIRHFVYEQLNEEMLWSASMPCRVAGEKSVPIARFGPSNVGRMKHIYRRGLAARYRSIMQIICGVHYNYSLPEPFWASYQELSHDPQDHTSFINDAYFALARNVQRYDWLITYLFGCSPALCKSFMDALDYPHDEYDRYTLYQQYATSLRQSDIGYKNQAASLINVSYDSLDAYVASLYHATRTPYPPYEAFGIFADGEYRQLNANLLQIENEYYGSVRPKRVGKVDERPLKALARGGVQYIELRSLDVNAFEPTGINVEQLQFLEAFLLFCLFQESPSLDIRQRAEAVENQQLVSHRGREPGLHLYRDGQKISLVDWAAETLDRVSDIAFLLDRKHPQQSHTHAVNTMRASILDADRTPSAQMIEAMDRHNEAFFEYAGRLAQQHQAYFAQRTLDSATRQFLNEKSETSRRQRIAIEEADSESFESYLARYFGQMSTVLAHGGSP